MAQQYSGKIQYGVILCLLLMQVVAVGQQLSALLPDIIKTIELGRQNVWAQMQLNQPLWNMPPWLGTLFISEYYFQLKALNITQDINFKSKMDIQYFRSKLLEEQETDGSWMQIVDLNRKQGSLDATIMNYWFLKEVGEHINSEQMRKARKFILDHGGIEESQVMTRYKLAVFGQYEWHLLHNVPLFLFKPNFPFSFLSFYIKEYVAQWVYPHLLALAYLRYHKTIYPVSKVCLSELRSSRSDYCELTMKQNTGIFNFKGQKIDADVDNILQEMISIRGKRGLYGGYTISTLLSLMSFKDYTLRYNQSVFKAFYQHNYQDSLQFVEELYFNRRVPYEGSLDDGRNWDTILAIWGLLQSGEDPKKVTSAMDYLVNTKVQENGGVPYGLQFEYAPDIDDTSMLLMVYSMMAKKLPQQATKYKHLIDKTYEWLKSTQNYDGGFPAFHKDKNDGQYPLITFIFWAAGIDKSAEIFDPSCPDIVGHLLEAIGQTGIQDNQTVEAAVKYLRQNQRNHMWSARWGINYIYAMGAVLPGLARVGYDLNTTWVRQSIQTLQSQQQSDGGFGQDSQGYNRNNYVKGVTTVSMTSWGLLALLEVADFMKVEDNISRAVQYLLRNFKEKDRFFDRSVVGTGHRGILNLQYPIYAYTFPLVGLSRARNLIEEKVMRQTKPKNQRMVNMQL